MDAAVLGLSRTNALASNPESTFPLQKEDITLIGRSQGLETKRTSPKRIRAEGQT